MIMFLNYDWTINKRSHGGGKIVGGRNAYYGQFPYQVR